MANSYVAKNFDLKIGGGGDGGGGGGFMAIMFNGAPLEPSVK